MSSARIPNIRPWSATPALSPRLIPPSPAAARIHFYIWACIWRYASKSPSTGRRGCAICCIDCKPGNGDPHRAEHALMEALAETLWQAQRAGMPPDEGQYLARVRRRLEG